MTVLTKTNDLVKKPEIINTPLEVGAVRYDVTHLRPDMRPRTRVVVYRSRCSSAMLAISFVTTLLMLLGAILALVFFSETKVYVPTRYKGYCTIPLDMAKVKRCTELKHVDARLTEDIRKYNMKHVS
ncbi:unnamed protein product [Diatraea saccharalis]|uniref:Uncharacterized protein n=1 Tax=Diatraea saccharalis TaxID=40085 RepID=A0A9N9QVE8_9NEOP|nr:unnamed protein product [Diatraea saccharalis]